MWGAIFGAVTGGFSSKYCLTGDTLVQTVCGNRCIADIKVGEQIYSYDEELKTITVDTVTQVIKSNSTEIIEILLDGETICATPSHPFLTDTGWTNAGSLRLGDAIITTNGKVVVDSINICQLDQPIPTYNLCVEKAHTFIVGENNVIVHNVCRTAPNQKFAGKRVHFDDPDWLEENVSSKRPKEYWEALAKKYPNGIYFKPVDAHGVSYPDFSEYSKETLEFDMPSAAARASNTCLIGEWNHDKNLANTKMGITDDYLVKNGLTWHHNENMNTLELIPRDLHRAVSHDGGASLIRKLLKLL